MGLQEAETPTKLSEHFRNVLLLDVGVLFSETVVRRYIR
ncbi:hypothetical protein LINGRAHAP2_LOCUS6266 [Linum grandiflorum]